MTNYQKEAKALIEAWLAKQQIKPVSKLLYIYPRAYVISNEKHRLVVARPFIDAEPQIKAHKNMYRTNDVLYTYDKRLKAGDWCATAYVCHGDAQESVAVSWED